MVAMILVGVMLAVLGMLLLFMLARVTVVEIDQFRRTAAVATLGVIMVAATLLSTGTALIGVSALLSFSAFR
ncbi:hypothetical protein AS188_16190 (plasmid) [Kocuria flava]|uniref:Uncharacterized protein n=2 Tax=Kocuria flava TaxID=446860 RepID=A0A0U3HKM7_9MICC|nr:hypothetical protein [Kocuria flava]ALU41432.1 hypothetical protein AS188_16190 [Kocuria flava]PLC10735.1 hypothetical protein AUQ48_16925 [Kocuria flava]GEO93559.1 hypothetical protein KFL01_28650 [Kocuria flava]